MPKKQKKPMKKALSRAASASKRRASATAAPTRKAAKRSASGKSSARAKPKAKPPAPKAKAKAKAKPPALNAKAKAKARPPAPKSKAKAKAKPSARKPELKRAAPARAQSRSKALPARSVILPPKSERNPGRVAPPPPRTPRELSVRPLRVTAGNWQQIEAAAARSQRGALSAEQRTAIRAALEGRDSLVVIPDDAQALACYQLCAPLLERPTVVLSPVLAELQAQHEALTAERKPVVCLLPELAGPDRSAALGRLARGGPLLVLLSPEALIAADVRKAVAKSGIGLFVVEEAHCASDLAHEIRPSYTELGPMLAGFGKPPVMALTRVATSAVLQEIAARLSLTDPVTVQAPAVRSNLRIVTRLAQGDGRQTALARLVDRLEPPGLILCASAHDVDSVYSALAHGQGQGRPQNPVYRYHSGMTPGDRAAELLNFTLPGGRGVMVAVSAFAPGTGLPGLGEQANGAALGFGRGSGKRDLRFLVHYQSPASIEQYLREIQRAGGDGLPATCVLFYESSHRSLHEVMLAQQRFRATHLADLGRALEAPALEGRSITLEALALATGQSRRTTDRLTALLADAGVISKTGGWLRVSSSASDLVEACRVLGAKLYALREQDGRRLSAVSAFAENSGCKLSYLKRYLGEASDEPCGRCSACSSELAATESLPPPAAARRPAVQDFSVRPVPAVDPSPALNAMARAGIAVGGGPLTAKLADFGAATPRAAR
jgi:ATP-dependent DNA helicase RecQ